MSSSESNKEESKSENENHYEHSKCRFTIKEDKKLKELVKIYGCSWTKISEEIKTKSARQCRNRWKLYLNPDLINKPFSQEETQTLMFWVEKCGTDWSTIVHLFPGRSGPSLKNHFTTYCSRNKIEKAPYIIRAKEIREERKKKTTNNNCLKKK